MGLAEAHSDESGRAERPGRVAGKVALVTGAASGIGRASAVRLAEEGARVVLADVDEPGGGQAAKEIGGDAIFLTHDVSDEASWQRVLVEAEARFGRLDVLVNNAGIVVAGDIEQASLEDYQRIQAVNAQGVFLGCKHVIPVMRRAGAGSIINISSVAALVATTGLRGEQGRRAGADQDRGDPLSRQG